MAEWPADLPAEAGLEYLTAGSILEAGQFVKSANDLSRAILQPDGNFVVKSLFGIFYRETPVVITVGGPLLANFSVKGPVALSCHGP